MDLYQTKKNEDEYVFQSRNRKLFWKKESVKLWVILIDMIKIYLVFPCIMSNNVASVFTNRELLWYILQKRWKFQYWKLINRKVYVILLDTQKILYKTNLERKFRCVSFPSAATIKVCTHLNALSSVCMA